MMIHNPLVEFTTYLDPENVPDEVKGWSRWFKPKHVTWRVFTVGSGMYVRATVSGPATRASGWGEVGYEVKPVDERPDWLPLPDAMSQAVEMVSKLAGGASNE